MPTPVTYLSWNIQTYGEEKFTYSINKTRRSQLYARAADVAGADIFAILELRSPPDQICAALVKELDNQPRPATPAAHWMLNEGRGTSARDISANTFTGTLNGGAAWQLGNAGGGYSIYFDGVDDYISTNYVGIGGKSDRSVAFWVKTDSNTTAGIVSWGKEADGQQWVVGINGDVSQGNVGAIQVQVRNGYRTSTIVVTDNTWHHVCVRFSGNNVNKAEIYIDGVQDNISKETARAVNTDTTADKVTIGRFKQGGIDKYFKGQVYGVVIYAVSLNETNIATLAFGDDGTLPGTPTAAWLCQEGAGTTANDTSTGVKHGTLQGAVWVPRHAASTGSVSFDGVDDYISTAYAGIDAAKLRSLTFWIKTASASRAGIISWGKDEAGKKWVICINHDNNKGTVGALQIDVHTGYYTGQTSLTDNKWHHVAVVLTGNDVKDVQIYIDGKLDTMSKKVDQVLNTDISNTAEKVAIGRCKDGDTYKYFQGLLEDIFIYDRALTAIEVKRFVLTWDFEFVEGGGTLSEKYGILWKKTTVPFSALRHTGTNKVIHGAVTQNKTGGAIWFPNTKDTWTKLNNQWTGRRPAFCAFKTTSNKIFTVLAYHAPFDTHGEIHRIGIQRLAASRQIFKVNDGTTDHNVDVALISGDFNIDYPDPAIPENYLGSNQPLPNAYIKLKKLPAYVAIDSSNGGFLGNTKTSLVQNQYEPAQWTLSTAGLNGIQAHLPAKYFTELDKIKNIPYANRTLFRNALLKALEDANIYPTKSNRQKAFDDTFGDLIGEASDVVFSANANTYLANAYDNIFEKPDTLNANGTVFNVIADLRVGGRLNAIAASFDLRDRPKVSPKKYVTTGIESTFEKGTSGITTPLNDAVDAWLFHWICVSDHLPVYVTVQIP